MLKIRRAEANEFEIITDLMYKSEAYWGFGDDYMEKFKSLYKVTKDAISNNPTYILQEDNNFIGFYGFIIDNKDTSLEYFFIDPKYIGKGYGKLLWNHAINECKKLEINEFEIITSPQAKEFYTKLGAVQVGELDCQLIKGRKIPRLIFTVHREKLHGEEKVQRDSSEIRSIL